jgi:hypothetical protein
MVFTITGTAVYGQSFGVKVTDRDSGDAFVALSICEGVCSEKTTDLMALLDTSDSVFYHRLHISSNGYVRYDKQHNFHTMIVDSNGLTVDHINRIRLDNRRKNLRVATMSEQNSNRSSYLTSEPPDMLKPFIKELPKHMRWDAAYGRFVSDKYAISGTRCEGVSIVNRFRDAAMKLKDAIHGDTEYSKHLETVTRLREEYMQINNLVHSKYPEYFDLYDDRSDKVYLCTLEYIDMCLSKLPAPNEDDIMHGPRIKDTTFRLDASNNICFMKRDDTSREIVFDMDFLEHFENGRKVDLTSAPIVRIGSQKIPLREYVWRYILKRPIPHGLNVGLHNSDPYDVRSSNLVLVDTNVCQRQRRKTVNEGFNDALCDEIDPLATVYSRVGPQGKSIMLFDRSINRIMPPIGIDKRTVSLLQPKMLFRDYVWNGFSTMGGSAGGIVIPLNYDTFDLRRSNLVKVYGISSARSFSAPANTDVPSSMRDRVRWEFIPFGLKYCFNKAQQLEAFNQSKMIDPGTKHWYFPMVSNPGVDAEKVSKIEESLGKCYRAMVELPGTGAFPADAPPMDVFNDVHTRYCFAMRTMRTMRQLTSMDGKNMP